MSLYLHYGWRDLIYDHISYLMQAPRISAAKAREYMGIASAVFGLTVATVYLEILYLRVFWTIPQLWLQSLQSCGKNLKTDPITGLLVPSMGVVMYPEG